MRASTLFRAYGKALYERSVIKYLYGSYVVGAVCDDPATRSWQRYDRLVRKLAVRLTNILEEYDNQSNP